MPVWLFVTRSANLLRSWKCSGFGDKPGGQQAFRKYIFCKTTNKYMVCMVKTTNKYRVCKWSKPPINIWFAWSKQPTKWRKSWISPIPYNKPTLGRQSYSTLEKLVIEKINTIIRNKNMLFFLKYAKGKNKVTRIALHFPKTWVFIRFFSLSHSLI